mgnify:CR=1 FL=1
MPERIQLRRTKGWRLPEGVVKVDRTTKYGNPFKLKSRHSGLVCYGPHHLERFGREWDYEGRISGPDNRHDLWFSRADIVETYVRWAGTSELVELFLSAGARPATTDGDGRTPADLAEAAGHHDVATRIREVAAER